MRPILFPVAMIALAAAAPLMAQGAKTSAAVELANAAGHLKPGQWVWAPEISPIGPLTVFVDLSTQTATVYRNGVRIGVSTISSGKPGHETPTGVFQILQKDASHHSSKYNNAPMPFQERLTWDGVALHAGGLPGYPESHGCVHLPYEFARLLFGSTQLGGTVIVAGRAGVNGSAPTAGVVGEARPETPLAAGEAWRWTPEASPSGPLTLIVSKSDQRLIVLRGGTEIGRARIELPDGDFDTHVFTLTRDASGQEHWLFANVPGHAESAGKPLDPAIIAQLRMPAKFQALLQPEVKPGTTVLVTQAAVLPETTGKPLVVMTGAGTND